jgi:predicted transcriptional regulator
MTQGEGSYGLVTQKVFHFLRSHPEEFLTIEDICGQLSCPPTQVRLALETLARNGVIDQEQTIGGRDVYVYHQRSPIG